MATLQAAPAQTYPVGETVVPPKANQQTFAQRTVSQGIVSIPTNGFADPNTAVDFRLELMHPDGTWILLDESTLFANSRHPVTTVEFAETWDTPVTVKGIRLRVDVRDAVAGSGLAAPVALGAITLTWN